MKFNKKQVEKLSDLFLDIAKGLFLASFVAPAISPMVNILTSLRSVIIGAFFTYLSLKVLELKEV